jgi:hypothetical protein
MARSADAEGERGSESVTYAPTDSAFFCIVEAAHVPTDTVFAVIWIALDAATDPNTEIQTTKRRFAGDGRIAFKLPRADEPWPQGRYRAEVRVDGVIHAAHEFSVSETDETTKEGVRTP